MKSVRDLADLPRAIVDAVTPRYFLGLVRAMDENRELRQRCPYLDWRAIGASFRVT